jgi:glycosyltransferase involved in cell wall biosynthesis
MARQLRHAPDFDLVLIEKEIFPFLPAWAERWLAWKRIPYVVDYDDAIFHNYDLHPLRLVRSLFKRKIARVMQHAAAVTCGNQYLADYARRTTQAVHLIPTVIDPLRYHARQEAKSSGVVIGWIGSPTSMQYLIELKPVLEDLVRQHNVRLHIVGGQKGLGLGAAECVLEWSEQTEAEMVSGFDIGIMPLRDSPWERGKCGYKLIQYMGCGLPVVGSPVGVNTDIIDDGHNGFLAGTPDAWKTALDKLIRNTELRSDMGRAGRRLVEERYNTAAAGARWVDILQPLMN